MRFIQMTRAQFSRRFNAALTDSLYNQDKFFYFAVPRQRGPLPWISIWDGMLEWGEREFGHRPSPCGAARWVTSGPDAHAWVAIRDEVDAVAFKMRWC
jgi:hypothetical protein